MRLVTNSELLYRNVRHCRIIRKLISYVLKIKPKPINSSICKVINLKQFVEVIDRGSLRYSQFQLQLHKLVTNRGYFGLGGSMCSTECHSSLNSVLKVVVIRTSAPPRGGGR